MDDLISRAAVWDLVDDIAVTVRPGSKLAGIIKMYANAIDGAPTIDAIPVEWLREKMIDHPELPYSVTDGIQAVLDLWKEEQEAR